MSDVLVRWPRVSELLEGIMRRWKDRHGDPMPGIHDYYWATPERLAQNKPYGRQLIEPGVPGKETHLVIFLSKGVGSIPRMPRGGPYLSDEAIEEIVRWIDSGMPE